MIKLTFYTTEKEVTVDMGDFSQESYTDVPTVQVRDGYYEVMKKDGEKSKPILRVPISQTIMYIQD
jgi:hypothetical protein